jgi:hypothetical protein
MLPSLQLGHDMCLVNSCCCPRNTPTITTPSAACKTQGLQDGNYSYQIGQLLCMCISNNSIAAAAAG